MIPSQIRKLLTAAIPMKDPLLIVGPPGIGKTDVVTQAVSELGYDLVVSHPCTADPSKVEGLYWIVATDDGPVCRPIPMGEMELLYKSSRPTVWFIDDIGQAVPAVQVSFMGKLLPPTFNGESVSVNGMKIPDGVSIVAATNRREDKAGVSGLLEPVKSRMTIVEMEPDVDEWVAWALSHDIDPLVVAFLKAHRRELFFQFEATADLKNSPLPRNWAKASRWFAQKDLERPIREAGVAGRVGAGPAGELFTFEALYQNATTAEEFIKNPKSAKLPTEMHLLYALIVALSSMLTKKQGDIMEIMAMRLYEDGLGEYATLFLSDVTRRCPEIMSTSAFTRIAASPLAKLLAEA